jgi:hypothetical protein
VDTGFWVAVAVACSRVYVGETFGEAVGSTDFDDVGVTVVLARVASGGWVAVGCTEALTVSVGRTAVDVAESTVAEAAVDVGNWAEGLFRVGVTGPGVGERVGTVWRAGSWAGVAQTAPESEAARMTLDTSKATNHCAVRRAEPRPVFE